MIRNFAIGIILISFFYAGAAKAEESVESRDYTPASGFIDLNQYYDTRDFTTTTLNLLAPLPSHFEYFSLVDYTGSPDTSHTLETEFFYTEQNLRWPIETGRAISLSAQWAGQSGPENDLLRAGILIRLANTDLFSRYLDGQRNSFSINIFPLQVDHLDGFNWQIEYFYRFQLLTDILGDRLYLSGFGDQNIDPRTRSTWVTEHQLGLKLAGPLHAIAEFRYNEFLPSRKTGTGLGLEYLHQW